MSIASAINDVSRYLGIKPVHLTKLINFESGFNPKARNPYSGARGLIQFMHSTAKKMGFKNADDLVKKYPTTEAQLRGPVLQYLANYKPFRDPYPQSLYLSVFYPKYRTAPVDTVFSKKVQKDNPGIKKVGDYVDKVERRTKGIAFIKKYSPLGFLLPLSAFAVFVYYNQQKGSVENGRWQTK